MKKLVIVLFSLSIQVFAAELNLNGGDSVIIQPNVSTKVTCGGSGSAGGFDCEEKCQQYLSYDPNRCAYQTQCLVEGNCMIEVTCDKFLSYDSNRCAQETRKKICH